jgi:hypothetical protein
MSGTVQGMSVGVGARHCGLLLPLALLVGCSSGGTAIVDAAR